MPNRKLPPNDVVIKMYMEGQSSGEIAEKCGVKPITVISLLRRLNIPRREPAVAAEFAKLAGRHIPGRYWLGKKQPSEMVEKRAAAVRGENHHLWKGGESRRDYRNVIDKENCDRCGTEDNLGIHHIDDDHYNNDPANLRVLCVSCHMSVHKTAYWKAKREGKPTPKSNAPTGWKRKEVSK